MSKYKQCLLVRDNIQLITWLPDSYAVVGDVVQLKKGQLWVDGWIVIKVWGSLATPIHVAKAIRDHRHRTEDDTPKNQANR